ncbi:MAG: hypothetical protein A2Y38_05070 [Spirochaetes bacterium GWB1_59_5]|nr:MAG: hypothetical protein A2Y38_05070 [Spirochaetes bacterium GWB1_59_5]
MSASQDAVIGELAYREGDVVKAGTVIARLLNPQLALAVGRAENGVLQATAAVSLARARFFEGELAAEAKLLGIEKTRLEILQSRRELAEAERKHADQETLYRAGGVTEEAIRSGRFSIESASERIAMMEKDIDIRLIGLRDQDLVARGISILCDEATRNRSLVRLSVAALAAEEAAAEARLEAARTDLQSSRLALAELLIVAPITGVIAARYLEAGERVGREEKILTIMSVESLYAVVSVFESDALRVSAGMEATVTVDGASADAGSVEFDGVVDLVSPVADASSASFSVRVVLHDTAGRLKPGMFAQVTITAGEAQSVLVVPESAVIERSDQSGTLCFISGGSVALRRVTLGSSVEAGRVILSGAASGDVIVDMPDPTLKEGLHVSISG